MQRKLNLKKLGVFLGCVLISIIVIIMFISSLVKDSKMKKTVEYRLGEVGYTENEIKVIKDTLKDEQIEKVINSDYNTALTKFLKEKYFIYANLDKYLEYNSNHNGIETSKIVSLVNVGADKDWYENATKTDTSKGALMLVNKFNGLDETYEPEDIMEVPSSYAYADNYISKVIYEDLASMLSAAKDAGYTLLVSQGYRSYKDQSDAYNNLENYNSKEYADSLAARAGYSEYQTGLGVEISVYGRVIEDAKTSEEHEWLVNNAHKYGFIIRYPEGKEDITGFKADDWRLRYVGTDVSSKIHSENITFDEYYAYYINK